MWRIVTIETGISKTRLIDHVRVHGQHIRQPEYQKLKVGDYLRTCGTYNIFRLLKM